MADIIQSKHHSKGIAKTKRLSTRIDLTPMVDLGFLLITFFIFTTTLGMPNVVKLTLPDDTNIVDFSKTPEGKTLTLILDKDNIIYYYNGFLSQHVKITDYHSSGLRSLILKTMNNVAARFGDRYETTILIKPSPNASYKNVVDVLDEMLISGVTRYVLMDISKEENLRLTN